jgi:cytochrome P450
VYLLYDSILLEKIRQETRAAFQDDEVDMDYLWEQCPQLESVYKEILRVMNAPIEAQTTMSDVCVGGKMLKADTKVLMPYRQLHLDEDVFGSDTRHFKAIQFLENRNLSRSPSLRPFGGGTTYCLGRFIVRWEAYLFVAVIIHHYEVALEGDSTFPRPDEETPMGGIIAPVKGDEVLVCLTPLEW